MMKIWDRVEQTLVGLLGLAALAFALWQVVSRYFFRATIDQLCRGGHRLSDDLGHHDRVQPTGPHRRPCQARSRAQRCPARCGAMDGDIQLRRGDRVLRRAGLVRPAGRRDRAADRRAQRLGSAVSDVDLLCGAAGGRPADARSATSSGWSGLLPRPTTTPWPRAVRAAMNCPASIEQRDMTGFLDAVRRAARHRNAGLPGAGAVRRRDVLRHPASRWSAPRSSSSTSSTRRP